MIISRRWLIVIFGFLGVIALTVGSFAAAFPYVGAAGEPYSPFNHFVSELGHTEQSEASAAFNTALFVGGISFALVMLGVGLHFTGLLRALLALGGAAVGISGALVGVFPMNVDNPTHITVALGFFVGSLIILVFFSLVVLFTRRSPFPRWLSVVSLPMIISVLVFGEAVGQVGLDALAVPRGTRPDFWLTATSEWGVIVFLLMWVSVIAIWRLAHRDTV